MVKPVYPPTTSLQGVYKVYRLPDGSREIEQMQEITTLIPCEAPI
jgi:hypothetical protein